MQACLTMMPLHGPSPERGSGGFEVTATQDTFAPGDIVPVTISGIRPFKGFLLQARTPRDDTIVGTFEPPPEGVRYLAECGDRNSVTHSNPNLKSSVTVFWRAPRSGLLRSIRFYVTVVESFSQIYRKLTSEIVISELDVVQAEYGPWGPWSTCSASCGPGIEQRTRVCPGNAVCAGTPNEIRSCNLVNCGELNYGPWSVWGPCTATCGYGMQDRTRECNSPFGCAGLATETRQCTLLDCPTIVTVNWNPWSSFSPCSATCGTGTRYRSRNCPLDGACIGGEARETIPCDAGACPVNWNQWSPFSSCSATCGSGVIFRSRTCPIDGACIGGAAREERTCDAGPCPVFWGEWGPFTACSSSCGAGVQTRKRTCPIEGSCVGGAAEEEQQCDAGECPLLWGPWSTYSPCSATCGVGMHFRQRKCSIDGACPMGSAVEQMQCYAGDCPDIYSPWTPWGDCSRSCGQGMQERSRFCTGRCFEPTKETRECVLAICEVPVWTQWSTYSPCSATCDNGGGQGVQERTRICPSNDPTQCPGVGKETRDCFIACDTASWANWLEWGQCSVTCGQGVQERQRFCARAFPTLTCPGEDKETRTCSAGLCPSTPVPEWTQWSTYSPCSATCENGGGQGVQERTRFCTSNDLTQCPGVGRETRDCFIACDTASWANWLEWGQCSVTCGQGIQERKRFCARAFPTLTCPGDDKQTRTCSAGLCPSQYTQWGVWGQCSVTCGDGIQRRNRICLGGACADPTTETRACSIICEAPKPVAPVVPVAPVNPKPNGQTNVIPSEPVKQPVIGTPDCYDCNSGWGVCAPSGITQPGWVGKTPCPKTKTCFIRRDKGGYVYRGCADAWPALASIATSQADGLSCISGKQLRYSSYVDVWCFCRGDRCNGGGM
ncbi:A disintegrin and metalloproteinase with thrombospondin motifs adt-1 isoform X3 [Lingula anatina]|uniref:A disintegrin and metalloproteinase with thrombospondin motifs adt-1 isoform X3 n=1 Tax=Lingula anatina TaxID=7574 RepID=A0A1S3I0I3_LINAN|nr:A disintegrin and metalloproteinase with thrombospondin motifs adt-1 isoform X3 [Lingula anatina]|eukprot:XP_013391772.1 A disintegrin and metalloproteinase with thrombospondin motifs adt-1 isoform X3 [Lingula anatina]